MRQRSPITTGLGGVRNLPMRLRRAPRRHGPEADEESTFEPRPEIVDAPGLRWINIESPRLADRLWLTENFAFHELDIEDVASHNQRPKLDSYDEYLFLVMQFPSYDKESGRLDAAELDIFVGPDFLISLPNEPIPPLRSVFERARARDDVRDELMTHGSGRLLYEILDRCVDAGFPMLGQLGRKLRRIENDIFEGRSREIVRDISNAKQEIINFRAVIRPQRLVFRDLERVKLRYLPEEMDIYFDDLTDAAERIWDVLENFKEIIEGLEDTNESVLSHRLNDVLRILTAVTVILLPLTLVTGFFGMNLAFPGEPGAPAYFWGVVIAMAVLLVALVVFFRRRGWL
jgi:magnesium transporter